MRRLLLAGAALPVASSTVRAEGPPLRIALFASFPPMAYKVPETGGIAGRTAPTPPWPSTA